MLFVLNIFHYKRLDRPFSDNVIFQKSFLQSNSKNSIVNQLVVLNSSNLQLFQHKPVETKTINQGKIKKRSKHLV